MNGKKNKTHVNDNEYADSCRFNPRSQIYSSHICQLIRWSHYYLGEKKQSPWDKFCFRLSLQIHQHGTALFWGLYNWIWWTQMNTGKKLKPVGVKVCDHFVSQIAHQIDRQSHNSGILHELCMSMDVWVWDKRVNPVNFKFSLQTLWNSDCTSDW